MALTDEEITNLYTSILRREPTEAELSAARFIDATQLENALLTNAHVSVTPIILIYQAAFNRLPDAAGLDYWAERYDSGNGTSLYEIVTEFSWSEEFVAIYGDNRSDDFDYEAFVTVLYQNVLGRAPDDEGLEFWVEQLESGNFSIERVLYGFATSDEFTETYVGAAENLLSEVAAGEVDLDDTDLTLDDFTPETPDTPAVQHVLTTGVDVVTLAVGDTVTGYSDHVQDSGSNDTYNGNDNITGVAGSGNEFTLSVNGYVTANGTVKDVGLVSVEAGNANTRLNTRNWTGIGEIDINNVRTDFDLIEIQSGETQININSATRSTSTVTLEYNAGTFDGIANIGVSETRAAIEVETTDGSAVETINLTIDDQNGRDSSLTALLGYGTTTLNITGGYEGGSFSIAAPLNASLTKLDASTAASDLTLDISLTESDIAVTLGSGDDELTVGNTLSSGDSYDGGDGDNRLVATLIGSPADGRQATVANFQTIDVSFAEGASLDGTNIDEALTTIEVEDSDTRADFDNFKSNVKTINVEGELAEGLEFDYDGDEEAELTVNFNVSQEEIELSGGEAWLSIGNANAVNINFNAGAVDLEGISLDDDTSTGNATTALALTSNGNAVVHAVGTSDSTIADGNALESVSFTANANGTLRVGGENTAALARAAALTSIAVTAANGATVEIGAIGSGAGQTTGLPATGLEAVTIAAGEEASVTSWGIDADNNLGAAADIETVSITGDTDSTISLKGSFPEFAVSGTANIDVFVPATVTTDVVTTTYGTWGIGSTSQSRTNSGSYTQTEYAITDEASGSNWLQAGSVETLDIVTDGSVSGDVTVTGIETETVTEYTGTGTQTRTRPSQYPPYNQWTEGATQWGNHWTAGTPTETEHLLWTFSDLVGLDLDTAGGTINVSGTGSVTGLWFQNEVASTINVYDLQPAGTDASGNTVTVAGFEALLGADVAGAIDAQEQSFDFAVVTTSDASTGFILNGSATVDSEVQSTTASLYIVGTDQADTLIGGEGDDVLIGGDGADAIYGTAGSNYLLGGAGIDTIYAGTGGDIIVGGVDRDFLYGGDGEDTFVFTLNADAKDTGVSTSKTNDVIFNFSVTDDSIVIDVDDPDAATVTVTRGVYTDGYGSFTANFSSDDYQILVTVDGAGYEISLVGIGGTGGIIIDDLISFV